MKKVSLLLAILCFSIVNAQGTKKKIVAKRVSNPPKIDGELDDDAWKGVEIATDFVMFRPESGTPEPENIKTEVKIIYDDDAIYFGAYLHDDKPEEIPMEFQTRDNFGNADFFGIVINPLNDGINQTQFFIMSTGNQNDARVLPNGREDWSWNAVWYSSVKVVDDGWIVEVKIPYDALRFSNEEIQTWGLNFHRQHRKNRDQYSWNFIDRESGNIAQYNGVLNGIKNIKPPVRLSFNPFVTTYTSSVAGKTEFDWTAGLDVKYGVTENFTLDATLIPDFGQVAFDNVILNLSPFEQQFSEQRAFFNEGTDLFGKGGLFESRRIGSAPTGRVETADNELVVDFPNKVDVLNIIKISGRTKNGLGIGVLNAVTGKTTARIQKTEIVDSEEIISHRDEVVEPLTNYNVFVLDKQFNKNSSVSLVNTNVMRSGHFRDANVTGLLFNLQTKDSNYGVTGGFSTSNIYNGNQQKPTTGIEGSIEIGKIGGQHQYDFEVEFMDEEYNKNDLGFQRRNNNLEFNGSYSYRIFEPEGIFNSYQVSLWGNLRYMYKLDESTDSYREKSNTYAGNRIGINSWFTTKKQLSFGGGISSSFGKQYNYFEPRVANRFFILNPSVGFRSWVSTDFSKKFAIDVNYFHGLRINESRSFQSFSVSPRYRISNKMMLIYSFNFRKAINQKGYVTINNDEIIFGNRDSKSMENTISTKYNFGIKSALSLSLRHFWSPVTYDKQFFQLELDGTLSPNDYTQFENSNNNPNDDINENINFNTWNLDLTYNWEFAPGSQLIALYRNTIFNQNKSSQLDFTENLSDLFKEDISQSFSIKLVYFIDYNQMKTWL
ncbi:MAG: carbohydrate binding family 9 domain-containing protein [Flavobacteriaceae bacterium]|nr:carbohydrate binding family 9 domain-containing protein [Flavobacteriaceae bacterium]